MSKERGRGTWRTAGSGRAALCALLAAALMISSPAAGEENAPEETPRAAGAAEETPQTAGTNEETPRESETPETEAPEEVPWTTEAEAEAARADAEKRARALAAALAAKTAEAESAEEEAADAEAAAEAWQEALDAALEILENGDAAARETAEAQREEAEQELRAAEEEAARKREQAERARGEAEELSARLTEAAMELKTATEASVRLARAEAVDSARITASFAPGEKFSGTFNDRLEPLYLRLTMDHGAKVRISTTGAKVSISVLNAGGNTILTLVPSPDSAGSVSSLERGEYILMVANMGTEKQIGITVTEVEALAPSPEGSAADAEEIEIEDGTEMTALVEFE